MEKAHLLAEGHELARLQIVDALDGASRGKGPARATLALILDRRHRAVLRPVDARRRGGARVAERPEPRGVALCAQLGAVAEVRRVELVKGLVRKLVELERGRRLARVVALDEHGVLLEDGEPPVELRLVGEVLLLVRGRPAPEKGARVGEDRVDIVQRHLVCGGRQGAAR